MSAGAGSGERLLAILDLFTEARLEWRPEEMQAALGYSRPTLYRYLKVLRQAGWLTSLPGAGMTLGPRVTELDFLMRRSDPLIRHGKAELDVLAARHPCSALLVRWYGRKLLCVASIVSTPQPRSSYPRGRPMPLARGAISRAILAWLPRRALEPLLADNLSEFAGRGMGSTADEIMETLRQVRRDGHAIARGEVTPGVVGVAAPVFDAGRTPVAALCVTSEEALMTPDRVERVAADVRRGAEALSTLLSERREEETALPRAG
jgi:DNA-binding IclR family transcriptional regulator